MVVKRRQRMSKGEDDDRPSDLLVQVVYDVPRRSFQGSEGPGNPEPSEEPDRMALRPAEYETEARLGHQQEIKQVMHRLRRELHPAAHDGGPLVAADQPPDHAKDDDCRKQYPEGHVEALEALLRRLGEIVPGLR